MCRLWGVDKRGSRSILGEIFFFYIANIMDIEGVIKRIIPERKYRDD
jgi:hypothetical protein